MSEEPSEPPAPSAPDESPPGSESPESVPPVRRRRGRRILRVLRITAGTLAALFAAAVVSLGTIDLGPSLRGLAERQGSKFIERPMRIGRLSAKLRPGLFVVEDLVIAGLTPQ